MIYIYTLKNPITNEIRYVGKTNDLKHRYQQHLFIGKKITTHCKSWIKSLIDNNLKPILEVIDICLIEEHAIIEKYWISQFKTWGFNLTNHTEGGEGITGHKHNKETIEKIRLAGLGRHPTEKSITSLVNYNRFNRTKEHCDNISKGNKGRLPPNTGIPMSIEQKQLLSIIKKGKPILKARLPILQLDLEDNFIKEWSSATEAALELKLTRANIVACLNNRRNKCGEYKWKYKIEDIVQL